MKNTLLTTVLIIGTMTVGMAQNVGIGTSDFTPSTDALLELRSTTSGFLMPKMTQAQRDGITSPSEGLVIYQTDGTPGYKYYDGSVWTVFGEGADNFGDHTATANIQLNDNWLSNDGGSEGIRISDNGNVGIGTAAPTEKLHVEGNIRLGDGAYIDDDATAGGNSDDWIRLNGYVELKSNSDNYGIVLRDKDNDEYLGMTQRNGYSYFSDNTGSGSYFLRGNGANVDIRGDLRVMGSDVYDNSGPIRLSGEDDVYITMDYNNNDSDSRAIRFGKNSKSSPTELMRISENGNVGIGTSSPDRLLNIGAAAGAQVLLTREDNSTHSGDVLGEIIFDSTDDTSPSTNDGSAVIRATASENQGNSNKGGELSFLTKHSGTHMASPAIERMRIDHQGNVGIGTSDPQAQLHTTGTVRMENLNGSGTRMVVADANGDLSTQAIPSGGGGTGVGSGSTLSVNLTSDINNLDVTGVSYLSVSSNDDHNEIKGLTGGVAGQIIYITNTGTHKKVKFKKNTGTQRFREDLEVKEKGGAIAMYNGTHWYIMSQSGD